HAFYEEGYLFKDFRHDNFFITRDGKLRLLDAGMMSKVPKNAESASELDYLRTEAQSIFSQLQVESLSRANLLPYLGRVEHFVVQLSDGRYIHGKLATIKGTDLVIQDARFASNDFTVVDGEVRIPLNLNPTVIEGTPGSVNIETYLNMMPKHTAT